MKRLVLLLIPYALLALSCRAPAPEKIFVSLKNTTSAPIEIRADAAGLSKTIRLLPGQTWRGWIPKLSVKEIEVEVSR